eukprot:616126-Rhodomonas_salina.2
MTVIDGTRRVGAAGNTGHSFARHCTLTVARVGSAVPGGERRHQRLDCYAPRLPLALLGTILHLHAMPQLSAPGCDPARFTRTRTRRFWWHHRR